MAHTKINIFKQRNVFTIKFHNKLLATLNSYVLNMYNLHTLYKYALTYNTISYPVEKIRRIRQISKSELDRNQHNLKMFYIMCKEFKEIVWFS